MLKLFVLLMCTMVIGQRYCNQKEVLKYLRIPTYDFSVRLLDRVSQETKNHFVFSPISTWLQLLALSDGAQGDTLNEIISVSRSNIICSRNVVKEIFNSLDTELSETIRRRSIFVIDKLLDVKDSFVNSVETLHTAKVLQARFGSNTKSAAKVNKIIDLDKNGTSIDIIHENDFRMSVLLVTDVASMIANWQNPFNAVFTKPEIFYSSDRVPIRYVNMMNQEGYFNFNTIPEIDAQALELPFSNRASMILLLPNTRSPADLFLIMKNIRMASLLRSLRSNGPRLVNVKMPRFNLSTDIDNMPDLLHDMGLERMFSPRSAEFKNISNFRVYVSMMATKFDIEVTEKGVMARTAPENIAKYEKSTDVTFNRPFAFLLIDNTSNVILFAGVYSKPLIF